MFNKLLANLPYNPSLLDQVAFYGKRLKQENSVRRLGFTFVALAFIVQIIAVASPPPTRVTASPGNNLVAGGVSSAANAASICNDSSQDYGTILSTFGITCSEVGSASVVSLNSTYTGDGGQLYSMGRQSVGPVNSTTGLTTNQSPVNIAWPSPLSEETVYWRLLHSWDTGPSSTYTALRFTNVNGQVFYILYSCGNLVTSGSLAPVTPKLVISKGYVPGSSVQAGQSVKVGQEIQYRIAISNASKEAANDMVLTDVLPAGTSFVGMPAGNSNNHSFHSTPSAPYLGQPAAEFAEWDWNTMPGDALFWYVDFDVTVTSVPSGGQICNQAVVRAINNAPVPSNVVCNTVAVSAPPASTPTKPAPTTPISTIPTLPVYIPTPTPTNTPTAGCPYDNTIPITSSACKPCSSSESQSDVLSCLTFSKSATNVTENIANANGTTAKAADVISYTLTTTNNSNGTLSNYTIEDNLADVLDFASAQNLNGGSINNAQVISWPVVSIGPHSSVQKTFTVQIDNPIPSLPASHQMTNVYGNTVTINLPSPLPLATTVAASTQLVNTGPGYGLFIAAGLAVVVGYFFARSRLLVRETEIVRQDYLTQGGI